jgi:hypothetical protein
VKVFHHAITPSRRCGARLLDRFDLDNACSVTPEENV